jgi:hypothetical protein
MASKGKGVDVGSTSHCTKKKGIQNARGIILTSESERERYNMLMNREICVNRYPDSRALEAFGIKSNVMTLLNNIGWTDFVGEPHYTFVTSTLEFMSTLCFVPDRENSKVSFSLGNVEYNMSLSQFCDKMGFASAGLIHVSRNRVNRPQNYDQHEFWSQITGRGHFESRTAKASMIQNPVFRYLHRVMACTIFGRPETATVRADELFILWAMVNNRAVNTGYYLLNHLAYVAAQPKGKMMAGGLISFIGWKLKAKLATDEIGIEGKYTIDIDFCKTIHMVRDIDGEGKNFRLLVSDEDSILLPDPSRTDTTNLANWLYIDLDPHVPPGQHAQDEEMGEGQQPTEGRQDDDDWRRRMEAKADRTHEEVVLIKQMLASQMQQLNMRYPPAGPQ